MSNVSSELHLAVSQGKLEVAANLIDSYGFGYRRDWSQGYIFLRTAAKNNNTEMVKLLLSRGCSVIKKSAVANNTPLHFAVLKNNTEIVELLLLKGINVNHMNELNKTALAIAVESGRLQIVKNLIKYGAWVHVFEADDHWTPLHAACRRNHEEMVHLLLKNGASTNARTNRRNLTPLHFAAEYGSSDVVNFFLPHGTQVDCEDKDGRTALQIAVARGELPVVEAVLQFHPDISNQGNKICLRTALRGHGKEFDKIVLALLEYGFNVNPEMAKDPGVFHGAVEKENLTIVGDLLNYGAAANGYDSSQPGGFSPLHRAVRNMDGQNMVKLLIQFNAYVNDKDRDGRPPLFYSVRAVDATMTKLLLTHGATVKDFPEVLHEAVRKNSFEIVQILLLNGADVNLGDQYERTALHFTVLEEYDGRFDNNLQNKNYVDIGDKLEVAQFLLNKGAIVNASTKTGLTTLHASIMKGCDSIADLLLKNEADVNLKDNDDVTALHISASRGNVDIATKILSKSVDINAKKKDGNTALHIAVSSDHKKLIKLLIDSGADVNCKGNYGKTPLHLAVEKGLWEITDALLTADANANARDDGEVTPLHLASGAGETRTVATLLEYGADINIRPTKKTFPDTPLDRAWIGYRCRKINDVDTCFNGYENAPITDTVEFLIRHQIRMEVVGLDVTKPSELVRFGEHMYEQFKLECQSEIEVMKSDVITGTNLSYYDILRKDTKFLAKSMKNENVMLVSESEEYKNKYPIYASMIKCQFRKGLAGIKLFQSASHVLNRLSELPEDCIEKILEFMAEDDLRVLVNV